MQNPWDQYLRGQLPAPTPSPAFPPIPSRGPRRHVTQPDDPGLAHRIEDCAPPAPNVLDMTVAEAEVALERLQAERNELATLLQEALAHNTSLARQLAAVEYANRDLLAQLDTQIDDARRSELDYQGRIAQLEAQLEARS